MESLSGRALTELKAARGERQPYLYLDQFRQALEHPEGLPAKAYPCLFGAGVTGLCAAPAGDIFICQLHYFGLKDRGQDPRASKIGDLERGIDWSRLEPLRGAASTRMNGCGDCKGYGCNPRTCMLANHNATGDLFRPDQRVCRIYKAGVRVMERFAREAAGRRGRMRRPASMKDGLVAANEGGRP